MSFCSSSRREVQGQGGVFSFTGLVSCAAPPDSLSVVVKRSGDGIFWQGGISSISRQRCTTCRTDHTRVRKGLDALWPALDAVSLNAVIQVKEQSFFVASTAHSCTNMHSMLSTAYGHPDHPASHCIRESTSSTNLAREAFSHSVSRHHGRTDLDLAHNLNIEGPSSTGWARHACVAPPPASPVLGLYGPEFDAAERA